MKLFLLLAVLLSGCTGSGSGGAWTPQDTAAAVGAVNGGLDTYSRARSVYRGDPYIQPVVPITPVAPVLYPY